MKRFLLIMLSIALVIFIMAGLFLSITTKDVFEIKLPFEMNQGLRQMVLRTLFTLGLSHTQIEYNDTHVTIAAGRSIYLPMTDGIAINMQSAIRSVDGKTVITIGIPALPLDSY